MQFSQQNKLVFTIIMLLAIGTLASDIYLPVMPVIANQLGCSISAMQSTLSLYYIGLGVAQLLAGPFIDKYGIKIVGKIGISIFIIATFICAHSPTISVLTFARIVQAFTAGICAAIGKASVGKLFDKEEGAKVMLVALPIVILSPGISPIFGGHIAEYFSWRAIFIFVSCIGVIALAFLYKYFPNQQKTAGEYFNNISTKVIWSYFTLLKNKTLLSYLFLICGTYVIYFAYITESPFLFHHFGYSTKLIGYCYILLSVSYLIASLITRKYIKLTNMAKFINIGMCLLFIGISMMFLVSLQTSYNAIELIVPMAIVMAANGIIIPLSLSNAMTLLPQQSGMVSALFGFIPMALSGVIASVIHLLTHGSVLILTLVMLSLSIVSLIGYQKLRH